MLLECSVVVQAQLIKIEKNEPPKMSVFPVGQVPRILELVAVDDIPIRDCSAFM